jgi:succinate dehydrogenase / fumarate reductase cytochrome b subunit
VAKQSFLVRNDFVLRRLHSLAGIVPIGMFLIIHLITNSSIVWGKAGLRGHGAVEGWRDGGVYYFQKEVSWINDQIPHLLLLELTLWISIAFHSIYGLYIAKTGKSNVKQYEYRDNWRYSLQRISGYVGILFIFYHVATLRWGWTWLVPGGTKWSAEYSASTLAAALRGGEAGIAPLGYAVAAAYMLGVSLLVFHFANGVWTAAITWGLTVSKQAQQRWRVVCTALGIGLMGAAWASLIGFVTLPPAEARSVEKNYHGSAVAEVAPLSEAPHRSP